MVREESGSNLFMDTGEDEEVFAEPLEFEDRYCLVGSGPLGEGTFGLVWRCRPKDSKGFDNEERAAKIVRKARLKPHEMTYLLGEGGEVRIHAAMKHNYVCELFEFFDEAHTVTMVLEYCRGGDLFDAIVRASKASRQIDRWQAGSQSQQAADRGIPENAAAVVMVHVLSALEYLHGHRVVHRDIKCENILLAHENIPLEQNVYKLADFGFAKYDTGDGLTDRLGSPDTVAPEIVAGSRYSTPADLWSAGVLLYMMLSARPPFTASSDGGVLKKVRAGQYSLGGPIWDNISALSKNLVASLMTFDVNTRPSATEAMRHEWLREAVAAPAA